MIKRAAQEAYLRFRQKIAQPILYDNYGNEVNPKSQLPILSMLLGGGVGGAAGHLLPNEQASILRRLANEITPEMVEAAEKGPRKWSPKVKDWKTVHYQVKPTQAARFKAPADIVKRFYKSKALQANAPRLLAGIGLGTLGGYLANKFIE